MWAQDLFDPNLTPEGVRAAIDAGAEVNVRDEDGYTALILAARWNGNPEVVRVLLDAGAMVNARSNWGWTPLMYAARWNGNPDILQVLLDAGGEMSARTLDSRTALIYTAWLNENPAVIQLLLDAGDDVSTQDNQGPAARDHGEDTDALKRTDVHWEPHDRRFNDVFRLLAGTGEWDLVSHDVGNLTPESIQASLDAGAEVNIRGENAIETTNGWK
jgi:hypothetical protein